jgi:hypothetical protein
MGLLYILADFEKAITSLSINEFNDNKLNLKSIQSWEFQIMYGLIANLVIPAY